MTSRLPDSVLAAIYAEPWAISPEGLKRVLAVASRMQISPEALQARDGLPLDNTRTVTVRDGVATIPVRGTLTRYAGFFSRLSGATSYGSLATDTQAALDNPAVRSLLYLFDTPGGEVNACGETAALLAGADKPTAAYIGGEGCSAGYWLAAACGEIVGAPSAIVGCLGVRMGYTDTRAADAAQGIVEYEWVSSETPLKALDPATDDGSARILAMVNALADVMLGDIATYRDIPRDEIAQRYGAGEIFVGQAALDRGLIDRLGSYEALHAELAAAGRPSSAFAPRWYAERAGRASSSPGARLRAGAPAGPAGSSSPESAMPQDPKAGKPADAPAAGSAGSGTDTPEAPAAVAPTAPTAPNADASIEARVAAAREAGRAEGVAEGRKLGADAEHTRMQGILGFANRGSLETIKACLADRACTPEATAARILGEETSAASHHLAGLAADETTIAEAGGPPAPKAKGEPANGKPTAAATSTRILATFAKHNPGKVVVPGRAQ